MVSRALSGSRNRDGCRREPMNGVDYTALGGIGRETAGSRTRRGAEALREVGTRRWAGDRIW